MMNFHKTLSVFVRLANSVPYLKSGSRLYSQLSSFGLSSKKMQMNVILSSFQSHNLMIPESSNSQLINRLQLRKLEIMEPIIKPLIYLPTSNLKLDKCEPLTVKIIENPVPVHRKHCARLIVIRKRKMKKHKLRKLRQKMKFIWLKYRQKKEYKKEKLFQSSQMERIYKAQSFDAAEYVRDVLAKVNDKPEPTRWK